MPLKRSYSPVQPWSAIKEPNYTMYKYALSYYDTYIWVSLLTLLKLYTSLYTIILETEWNDNLIKLIFLWLFMWNTSATALTCVVVVHFLKHVPYFNFTKHFDWIVFIIKNYRLLLLWSNIYIPSKDKNKLLHTFPTWKQVHVRVIFPVLFRSLHVISLYMYSSEIKQIYVQVYIIFCL